MCVCAFVRYANYTYIQFDLFYNYNELCVRYGIHILSFV